MNGLNWLLVAAGLFMAFIGYEQLAREVLTLGRKKELGRGGFAPTR